MKSSLQDEQKSVKVNVKVSRNLTVSLCAQKAGKVTMKVNYLVINAASWSPSYDVRVQSAKTEVIQMIYYGLVRQWSGEDWNAVCPLPLFDLLLLTSC